MKKLLILLLITPLFILSQDNEEAPKENPKKTSKLSVSPEKPTISLREKIKELNSNVNQYDVLYYTFNNETPYNITYFKNYTNQNGIYLGIEFTPHTYNGYKYTIYEVVDNVVQMYDGGSLIGSFGPTIEQTHSEIAINCGRTLMLIYPFWISVGVGINYIDVDEKRAHYYSTGSFWDYIWIKNKDESGINAYVEADLQLKILKRIFIKSGIRYKDELNFQFGLGYAF